MRFHQWLKFNGVVVAVAAALVMANPARAHVRIIVPNGGEELEVGSTYTIRWTIVIQHNQQNWDLWYSTTGPGGPWTTIVANLPPGPFNVGSVHTYDWTIPDAVSDQVRVRVRMDNAGTDYFDISDGDLSIVPIVPTVPTGFTVVKGLLLSGGLEDLFDSDDARVVVSPATLAPPTGPEPPVQIEIVATSTTQTPSELRFRYEGHVFMPDAQISTRQRTSLFNYVTQSYDELDNRLAASSDEVFEIVITANPADYIEPGTGNMKAFITYKAEGLSGFLFAVSNLDQTVWMIAP